MGRPDKGVIKEIGEYKFKKSREDGNIFVSSPEGVNFRFNVAVFKELQNELEENKELRERFGLNNEN